MTTGTKAQLIARIEGGDAGGEEAPKAAAKKKAPAPKKKAAPKKKKAAEEEEEEEGGDDEKEEEEEEKPKAAKAAKSGGGATAHEGRRIAVDRGVPLAGASVYPGHGVMLNQTNLAQNNNKFYVIQLLDQGGGQYAVWTRWGRVGEHGQSKMEAHLSLAAAIKLFEKKFKEKTKNTWSKTVRDDFKPQPGKYTLLDMKEDEDDGPVTKVAVKHVNKDSKLPHEVQVFVRKIYSQATGNLKRNIDCEFTSKGIKTPLGVLSLGQVERGDAVLDRVQALLDGKGKGSFSDLSSEYYTLIPHAHGRVKPPLVNTPQILKEKQDLSQLMKDMLLVSASGHESVLIEDDVDAKYEAMGVEIRSIAKGSPLYKNLLHHIAQHWQHEDHANMSSKGDNFDPEAKCGAVPSKVSHLDKEIVSVFAVARKEEHKRFNSKIGNEHLMFHASRFENWVGILSRGLLQPAAVTKLGVRRTDFGWLGSGVYFGSEWSTSSGYCQPGQDGTGCMLVQRVALGRVQEQTQVDGSISGPAPGFDSIHGNPDVPGSGFADHEYAVYDDDRSRMEYLIEFKR